MAEPIGLKETLELLDGVKLLAVAGKKVGKDGIDLSDLQHLVGLAKDFAVLAAAVEGADGALAELKALDEAETIQLIAAVFGLVKAVKEA